MKKILALLVLIAALQACQEPSAQKEVSLEVPAAAKKETTAPVKKEAKEAPEKETPIAPASLQDIKIGKKISLKLPGDFKKMPLDVFYHKYPHMDYDASDAYSDAKGEISLLIEQNEKPLPPGDFMTFAKKMAESFKQGPGVRITKMEEVNYHGKDFLKVEFTSQSIDANIYNWFVCTELDQRLLVFNFNCLESQYNSWMLKADQIIQSIKIK